MTCTAWSKAAPNRMLDMNPFAWSYSALTAFETCPKKFAATRVFKTYKEPEGEQLIYGNRVHKSLELRVRNGQALPADLVHMETTLQKLLALGTATAEESIGLDRAYHQTDYFDKPTTKPEHRVWLRMKADLQLMLHSAPVAILLDYKTGKIKEDLDQLELFAAVTFALHPEVQEVRTGYWWTNENRIDPTPFKPQEAPVIWQKFLPRVKVLENAYQTNAWTARPSGLCREHCPVTECAFHGKGNR